MERTFTWTNRQGDELSLQISSQEEQSNLVELFEAEGVEYKLN